MMINTPEQIQAFRLVSLKIGLQLYLKSGLRPNRNWTLSAMLRNIGEATGQTYPTSHKAALQAIADIEGVLK